MFRRNSVAMILPVLCCLYLTCPAVTIEGTVRNKNTHEEIPNANIYVEGQPVGTTTDQNGRYQLNLRSPNDGWVIIFDHIAFDSLKIPLGVLRNHPDVYLQPKIMQLAAIRIEGEREASSVARDLPQPLIMFDDRKFELRGYTDAGDLLKTEQSIQIEEELSGRKTITLRAGNADDIIVLFHGIKMNNAYDHIFDLSLINLDDIERIEIIKGSNTSLYGPDAFSGVINVVPKVYKNYLVRFEQRIGTYASGDWNLQLNHHVLNRLNLGYTFKKGASKRTYSGISGSDNYLQNDILNHSGNLILNLSRDADELSRYVTVMYQHSELDYTNMRDREQLANRNRIMGIRYTGNLFMIDHLTLTAAWHKFEEEQRLSGWQYGYERDIGNETMNFNAEKIFSLSWFEYLLAYQREDTKLDFQDLLINPDILLLGVESARYTQLRQGLASILKFHPPAGSDFLNTLDVSLSYRYDMAGNIPEHIQYREDSSDPVAPEEREWSESTVKFSSQLKGKDDILQINTYLNYGSNIKFPSIFQQLSTPLSLGPTATFNRPNLEPERNTSLELGGEAMREVSGKRALSGWGVSLNYFRNDYRNKFRMYRLPASPLTFYDNVPDAAISGFDLKGSLFLLKNKVVFEMGTSQYAISDLSAFPFKSDSKRILNLFVDHSGYSFQLHWFREGDQVGAFRNSDGRFIQITLPAYSNMDLHLSKTFQVGKLKLSGNLSARNIFDDKTAVDGLTIRDRRYYLTMGIQY